MKEHVVTVPEGGPSGADAAAFLEDLIKAMVQAKVTGHASIARDVEFDGETWRLRLKVHRKDTHMGEKQAGGGYVLRAEHEEALKAHLEAQGLSLPAGVSIADILAVGGKIVIGIFTAAATGEADVKGVRIPHYGIWDIHGKRRDGS